MTKPEITAIPEERVAAILARAAELDQHRRETITVDAIRTAALDAGISPSAVEAALEEYAAGQVVGRAEGTAEREPRLGRARRAFRRTTAFFRRAAGRTGRALKSPLKLAALMFIMGLAGAAGEAGVTIAFVGWFFLVARLVLKHRPSRRIAPYALALVVMTIGGLLGFAAGEVDEDAIAVMAGIGVALLVAGSIAIKARLPRRWRRRAELEGAAG